MPDVNEIDALRRAYLVDLDIHGDDRGIVVETYRRDWVPGSREMAQANRTDREAGCLVGMHHQLRQADYWYVLLGTALAAPRPALGEPDRHRHVPSRAGARRLPPGLYIPPGVAHRFWAVTDMTVTYLVDDYYNPDDELGVSGTIPRWRSPGSEPHRSCPAATR